MREVGFVPIALVVVLSLAIPQGGHRPSRSVDGPSVPIVSSVDWWYDGKEKAICWDGSTGGQFMFLVDLDGIHQTSVTSEWETGTNGLVVGAAFGLAGRFTSYPGIDGSTVRLSQHEVNPPVPHASVPDNTRFPVEWYHLFVTKLAPPSNYVLGLQGSDGTHVKPIDSAFWISEDSGATWRMIETASAPSGRQCKEDSMQAEFDLDPDTLNLESLGAWVTAYIELPVGHDAREIDPGSVLINGILPPVLDPRYGFVSQASSYIVDHDRDGVPERLLKFDRSAFSSLLVPGLARISISGSLFSGIIFRGETDLRVTEPHPRP